MIKINDVDDFSIEIPFKMPPKITRDEKLFRYLNSLSEDELIAEIAKYKKIKKDATIRHLPIAQRMRSSVSTVSLIERFGYLNVGAVTDYITAISAEIEAKDDK